MQNSFNINKLAQYPNIRNEHTKRVNMFDYPKHRYAEKMKQQAKGMHSSSNQISQLDAVAIRNLTYEVGRGRNKKLILNKINLTVPEGSM